jgi:hypothetical protein
VHSNRLALYWVEDRWRWPLMLCAGAAGAGSLVRIARAGRPVPAAWLTACLALALAGLAGLPVPVWWRFVLFCQLPLALGLADFLVRSRGLLRGLVAATLGVTLVFKLATLFFVSDRVTYFGTELQPAWRLGSALTSAAPGVVATDPFTAYYIPATTGRHVLSVTKAHVGSASELAASQRGYLLLHRFYSGADWWDAARAMWRQGVRYVIVEHQTSLDAPTLEEFSTGPTPLVRTPAERRRLGTYFYRNNRVGRLVGDSPSYAIYRLDGSKLRVLSTRHGTQAGGR